MADALKRLRWEALRAAERVGAPGVAAAVLALAAGVAWAAWGLPLATQAREAAAEADRLSARLASARGAGAAKNETPSIDRRLADFERGLPPDTALSASYGRLWNLARRHGVQLRQAQFKWSEGGQGGLARYVMTLPVNADYPSLRAFAADALREMPALAMEEMSVRRDDAKSPQLEAQLRLVLFVRGAQ